MPPEPPDDLRTRLALLERDLTSLRESQGTTVRVLEQIQGEIRKATLRPVTLEAHDGTVHASCPNCGATGSTTAPLPRLQDWQDLEPLLNLPHEQGKDLTTCTNCAPRFKSWVESHGWTLAPKRK